MAQGGGRTRKLTEKDKVGSSEKWTFAYDNKNELTEAKHFDSSNTLVLTADYKYEALGNRVEKDVTDTNGTAVARFAVDGWNPAVGAQVGNENFSVYADLNGSGDLTTRYIYGDVVDQILARLDGNTPRWYLTDRQGSVRKVLGNTGAALDAVAYDGFGNITTQTDPTMLGRYAYTGREIDVETGLQYNRARYYDATTGRWMYFGGFPCRHGIFVAFPSRCAKILGRRVLVENRRIRV